MWIWLVSNCYTVSFVSCYDISPVNKVISRCHLNMTVDNGWHPTGMQSLEWPLSYQCPASHYISGWAGRSPFLWSVFNLQFVLCCAHTCLSINTKAIIFLIKFYTFSCPVWTNMKNVTLGGPSRHWTTPWQVV